MLSDAKMGSIKIIKGDAQSVEKGVKFVKT